MACWQLPVREGEPVYKYLTLLISIICFWPHWATADNRLTLIKQRGDLIVGIKSDYPPLGMINDQGELVGLEADLAKDMASRLGVELILVAVNSSNRIQKVQDGSIDLIIATMGDTVERRNLAGLLEPNYYASGVNVLLPRNSNVKTWNDLRGHSICMTDGAYYNRTLVERYLFAPVVFKGTRDAALALKEGRCVGWAYDDLAFSLWLKRDAERWQDFIMPLPSILVAPWAIAVRSDEKETEWGRFVSSVIEDWHRSGFLIELQAAWGMAPSSYLEEQRKIWLQPECMRRPDGTYPPQCLDQNLLKASARKSEVFGNGLVLQLQEMGIDFPPFYDDYHRQRLLLGIGWTFLLCLTSILGSLTFGIAAGATLNALPPFWKHALGGGISVFYMTPPILNLYLIMLGIGGWMAAQYGVSFNAFWVACFVFSLYAGGSNAVIVSSSMEWVSKQNPERSIRILLALAIERGCGGLIANTVNIAKAVGIASTLAVPEVIFAANSTIAEQGTATEMMSFLLAFYLVLISLLIFVLEKLKLRVMKWASQIS